MEFEKLYTAEDVAQITGLTLRTIRNYIKDGRLKGRRIGVQWRFTAADIQALFDAPVPEPAAAAGEASVPVQEIAATESVISEETVSAPAVTAAAEAAVAAAESAATMGEETDAESETETARIVREFLQRKKAPRFSACSVVDIPGVTEQEARFLYNRLQSLAKVYQDGPKRLELSYEYDEFREQARFVFSGAMESACAMMNLCEVQ